MGLEPILLEAALAAVLGWLARALWAGVEWHELLLELRTLLFSALLFLDDLFQWAHLVLALGDVDRFAWVALFSVVESIERWTTLGIFVHAVGVAADTRTVAPAALLGGLVVVRLRHQFFLICLFLIFIIMRDLYSNYCC